jgi:uncharacterized protein (DUF1697 family)
LRGINLGPARRVKMAELRDAVAGLGYGDVRTLGQSGNVLLTSDDAPDAVARALEAQIAARLGVESAVVVRTRDELAAVVGGDPLAGVATDPKRYQVTFLSAELAADVARELAEADVAPEQVVVKGREIYAWHPDGLQRSALARRLVDRRLGVVGTSRNWATVTKLLALAGD